MHPFFLICSIITIWTLLGGIISMVFGSVCAFASGKDTMSEAEYYKEDDSLEPEINNERVIQWASWSKNISI